MSEIYRYEAGSLPLLVSIPHDGCALADGMQERMTDAGRDLPDTDWHVTELYAIARELGAHVLCANYSRYVVDLNRPPDDAALYEGRLSTGLCPTRTFDGRDIYRAGQAPDDAEVAARRDRYWRPYHEMLRSVLETDRNEFGYALLWDAHSIRAEVPALFDGVLPDLNIGTDDGRSCGGALEAAVAQLAAASRYSLVVNGRFRGGYTTRHYGKPAGNVHAIQLEIAQRTYMDEEKRRIDPQGSVDLSKTLRAMLATFIAVAEAAGDQAPVG